MAPARLRVRRTSAFATDASPRSATSPTTLPRPWMPAGSSVGPGELRRNVMGPDAVGNAANDEQLDALARLLRESLAAGGLGFSTTLSFTHSDGDGEPVASRWATDEELLALCRTVSEHEGTT